MLGGKIFCYHLVYHLRISLARFDHLHQNWSTIINSKVSFVVSDYNPVSFSQPYFWQKLKWSFWRIHQDLTLLTCRCHFIDVTLNDHGGHNGNKWWGPCRRSAESSLLWWWLRYMEVLLKWKGKYSYKITQIRITVKTLIRAAALKVFSHNFSQNLLSKNLSYLRLLFKCGSY